MKLVCPFSSRFDLDVFHLPAADTEAEEALHNGKAQQMMSEVLIKCYDGPEDILVPLKKKILAIGLEQFSGAWSPGGGLDALIDLATFSGSMWITDDSFDDLNQDEDINSALIQAWSNLPKLIGDLYKADSFQQQNKNSTKKDMVEALYDETLALYPEYVSTSKYPVINCNNRMFILSVAAARVKAGNDDVFDFFTGACKTWSTNSCSDFLGIRGKGYKQVSPEELRSWRSVNSGSIPVFAYAIAVHGVAIPREMFQRSEIQHLFFVAGQHIGISNDIMSYDREVNEEDGWTNYVEYIRLTTNMTLDEAIGETVRQINYFTDDFIQTADDVILKSKDMKERNLL